MRVASASASRMTIAVVVAVATSVAPPATAAPVAPGEQPPPAAATRLFTGDYSTGGFQQWPGVQTKAYNGPGTDYPPDYSASIVSDPVKGNAARFEVRSGDRPEFGGGERAEVQSTPDETGGVEGDVRWYAFSTKFDPSFSRNHADLGWGLTNQWHADAPGSPPVGWYVDQRNGFWSLVVHKQARAQDYEQTVSIFDVPLAPGTWHDVKMQVRWSSSDADGWIRLWLNGVRQTFSNGTDTFNVRTMVPGTSTVYYKEGIYREATAPTDIVYHSGFRSATSEAGL
jgi:hypothetical protein